jgi:hypothetical protein
MGIENLSNRSPLESGFINFVPTASAKNTRYKVQMESNEQGSVDVKVNSCSGILKTRFEDVKVGDKITTIEKHSFYLVKKDKGEFYLTQNSYLGRQQGALRKAGEANEQASKDSSVINKVYNKGKKFLFNAQALVYAGMDKLISSKEPSAILQNNNIDKASPNKSREPPTYITSYTNISDKTTTYDKNNPYKDDASKVKFSEKIEVKIVNSDKEISSASQHNIKETSINGEDRSSKGPAYFPRGINEPSVNKLLDEHGIIHKNTNITFDKLQSKDSLTKQELNEAFKNALEDKISSVWKLDRAILNIVNLFSDCFEVVNEKEKNVNKLQDKVKQLILSANSKTEKVDAATFYSLASGENLSLDVLNAKDANNNNTNIMISMIEKGCWGTHKIENEDLKKYVDYIKRKASEISFLPSLQEETLQAIEDLNEYKRDMLKMISEIPGEVKVKFTYLLDQASNPEKNIDQVLLIVDEIFKENAEVFSRVQR